MNHMAAANKCISAPVGLPKKIHSHKATHRRLSVSRKEARQAVLMAFAALATPTTRKELQIKNK